MQGPRYFVAGNVVAGVPVELGADDARHAKMVLRSRSGEPLTLLAAGVAWDAEFASVGNAGVSVVAKQPAAVQSGELPAAVTVLQALTKGAKFDEVVEKTVELGAVTIVPVIYSRSETLGSANKADRWRRIARAAAMQSRRRIVPIVEDPVPWKTACERAMPGAMALVAYERAESATLAAAIARYQSGTSIVFAVGPEGGLTEEEVALAHEHGAHTVSLGPTILRTETAASALLAATAQSLGWW